MAYLKIFRYDPSGGVEPHFQTYQLPPEKGMTVLEALFWVLENKDPSLAFRCSCRESVCGSCAMHINGEYRLACKTQVDPLGEEITIRPLTHLPILKDLVVDMKPFFDQYEKIKPYLIPKEEPPEGKEYYQSVKDRKKIDTLVDCILCGACYGSCPVALGDPNYLGPHALAKALRFVQDSRDGAQNERLAIVATEHGVFRCHTIFNCQKVCPKDIDPTGAIAKLKMKSVGFKLKSMFGFARSAG
jgi:succinate dehydrogenase / fumarate reductase iron-sulfur subunit